MRNKIYNIDLCKGTGLVNESLSFFEFYRKGRTRKEMVKEIIENNLLGKSSEKRTADILNYALYKRFVIPGDEIPVYLHSLRKSHTSLEQLKQVLFLYTCRANPALFDFVTHIFWKHYSSGNDVVKVADAKKFLHDAVKYGNVQKKWSEGTITRMSRYLIVAMKDFNLLDKKNNILSFAISDITANYLTHELHFWGYTDNRILVAEEWQLFGLTTQYDVLDILKKLSFTGNFIIQHSGDLTKITWKYESMKQFIDGITQQ